MRDERTPVLLGLPGFCPSVEPRRPRETVGSRTSQRAGARNPSRQRQERARQIAPLARAFRNAYATADSARNFRSRLSGTRSGAVASHQRKARPDQFRTRRVRWVRQSEPSSTHPFRAATGRRRTPSSAACPTAGHAASVRHRTEARGLRLHRVISADREHNRMIPLSWQIDAARCDRVASRLQSVQSDGEPSCVSFRGTSSRAARVPAFRASVSGPRAARLRASRGAPRRDESPGERDGSPRLAPPRRSFAMSVTHSRLCRLAGPAFDGAYDAGAAVTHRTAHAPSPAGRSSRAMAS